MISKKERGRAARRATNTRLENRGAVVSSLILCLRGGGGGNFAHQSHDKPGLDREQLVCLHREAGVYLNLATAATRTRLVTVKSQLKNKALLMACDVAPLGED